MHVVGDLDFLSNDLDMPHYNSREQCCQCGVNRVSHTISVRDVAPNAAWKHTLFDVQDRAAPSPHDIWQIPGMCRWSVVGDWMHLVDLGTGLAVIGPVMAEIVLEGNSTFVSQLLTPK